MSWSVQVSDSQQSKLDENADLRIGTVLQSADGIIQAFDVVVEQMFGYPAEQLIGKSFLDLMKQTIHPDGSPFLPDDYPPIVASRTRKPCLNIVLGFYKPNHDLIWLRFDSRPLFQSDSTTYAVVTILSEVFDLDFNLNINKKQNTLSSVDRVQAILANIPGMIYRYIPCAANGSDAFSFINSGCRDLFEVEPEAGLEDANSLWKLIHPDDLQSFQASVTLAVENFLPWEWTGRIITPNGKTKWIQGKSSANYSGEREVWDGWLIDITERIKAQSVNQTLKTLITASPLPIVVIEPDNTVQLWNPAATRVFGWDEAEVLGKQLPIVPTDKIEECRQIRASIVNGETIFGIETYRCKKDGSRVVVSISAAPLSDETSTAKSILFIFKDITQQHEASAALRDSEERFRLAVQGADMATWDVDLRTHKAVWNDKYFSLLGYSAAPNGEATIEMWRSAVHRDDLDKVLQAIELAQRNQTVYCMEYRIIRRDNQEIIWLAVHGRFLYNEANEPVRVTGVSFDITQRVQLEVERERVLKREQAARAEAERANLIKDEFLAVLSHELRSPLNPILGWTQLLQKSQLNEAKRNIALSTIERNAKLQSQLIEDLLDISRIMQGKLTLTGAPVQLANVILGAVDTVRLAAEAKQIRLILNLDSTVEPVIGDADRLQQVVWNLLTNAIKFSNQGEVTVELRQINNIAQIRVIDQGIGIKAQFLPYVFEYFRQEDSSNTRKFGGLGLGLTIVHRIIEMHGGTVSAGSLGENQGATFTVQLPVYAPLKDIQTLKVLNGK
ncbi:putative PAS/PAC sensor protein [Calothrix sp. NIES-4071]|nr:putative PAS/PAC sensor protein [Calothrix sp. NIES-4071]BAZ59194.1 putative PAS/PAC sensor protein [Calothrix sp. NIES-4105]